MGKLGDAIKEYKISPINSPREREAKEIIEQITGGEWWKTTVGTEFKWPKKWGKAEILKLIPHEDTPTYYFQNIKTPNIYNVTGKPDGLLSNPEWKLIDEKS